MAEEIDNIQNIQEPVSVETEVAEEIQPESKEVFNFHPKNNPAVAPSKDSFDYDATNQVNDYSHALDFVQGEYLDVLGETQKYIANKKNNKQSEKFGGNIVGPSDMQYADLKDVEKYIYQDSFEGSGFNPSDEYNHQRWVSKESWGTAMMKGLDSFGERYNNTFTDYWKDYGRMANALVHFDTNRLIQSEEEMARLNLNDHITSMRNYVFVDEETEDDIFSRKSISEFVGNAGFALGTISAMSLEILADVLLTVATAPAGGVGAASFGITATKIGFSLAKIGAKFGMKKAVKKLGKEAIELGVEASVTSAAMKTAKTGVMASGRVTPKKTLFSEFFNRGTTLAEQSVEEILKGSAKGRNALKYASQMKQPSIAKRTMKELQEIISFNTSKILKSDSFYDFSKNILGEIPILGQGFKTGRKMIAAGKAGESGASIAGMAYRGVRRMAQEYNLAATEASFEAVSTYGDLLDKMVADVEATGRTVTADELAQMKEYAQRGSIANYGTNMAILLATNKIQFGSIFNRFTPANKITREILDQVVNKQARTLGVKGFAKTVGKDGVTSFAEKQTTKFYKKGFFGTYGLARQISKDYGKMTAAREVGKTYLRSLGKFEISEGIQENLQETSNSAWTSYYQGKMNGVEVSLSQAFGKGASEQFTKQGFKTFLQGALTGGLIKGPVKAMTATTQYAQRKSTEGQYEKGQDPYSKAEKQLDDDINTLNEFMTNLNDGKFENKLFNFQAQLEASETQADAAAKGKEFEFNNGKDNALLTAVVVAHRTGAIDAFTDAIRETGNMTKEEFEESYGVKLEDTKYNTPQEFADKIAGDVVKYKFALDDIRQSFKNKIVDPLMYEEGSQDQKLASMHRNVQEEAISMMALNSLKATRTSERAIKVVQAYNEVPGLAESSDYIFRVLANPDMITAEKGNLNFEIRRLEESLKEDKGVFTVRELNDINDELNDNKRELKALTDWESNFETVDSFDTNIDQETGEKITNKVEKKTTFVGEKFVTKYYKKTDPKTGKRGAVSKTKIRFKEDSAKIKQTYRKIVNLKNKQGGININVKASDIDKGFQYVLDFMKLEKNAMDFMKGSEALNEPQVFKETLEKMSTGRLKSEILNFVDSLEKRIQETTFKVFYSEFGNNLTQVQLMKSIELSNEFTKELQKSEPYQNIVNFILSDSFNINDFTYVQQQIKEIDVLLNEFYKNKLGKEIGIDIQLDEVIDDDVWTKHKTDKTYEIPETILDDIARTLFDNNMNYNSLSVREAEIVNDSKYTQKITARIAVLKKAEEKARESLLKYDDKDYTSYEERMKKLADSLTDLGRKQFEEFKKENKNITDEELYNKLLTLVSNTRYRTAATSALLNRYNAEDQLLREDLTVPERIVYMYIVRFNSKKLFKDIISNAEIVSKTGSKQNLSSEMEQNMYDLMTEINSKKPGNDPTTEDNGDDTPTPADPLPGEPTNFPPPTQSPDAGKNAQEITSEEQGVKSNIELLKLQQKMGIKVTKDADGNDVNIEEYIKEQEERLDGLNKPDDVIVVDEQPTNGKKGSTVTSEELEDALNDGSIFENGWTVSNSQQGGFDVKSDKGDFIKSFDSSEEASEFIETIISNKKDFAFISSKLEAIPETYDYTDADIMNIVDHLNIIKDTYNESNDKKIDSLEHMYNGGFNEKVKIDILLNSFNKTFEEASTEDTSNEFGELIDLDDMTDVKTSDPNIVKEQMEDATTLELLNELDAAYEKNISSNKKTYSNMNSTSNVIEKNGIFDKNSIEFEALNDISDIEISCEK